MGSFTHPLVAAAKRELNAIYLETGGTRDPINNPNKSPGFLAAQRVFRAVLDAEDAIWCERYDFRRGKRSLAAVR